MHRLLWKRVRWRRVMGVALVLGALAHAAGPTQSELELGVGQHVVILGTAAPIGIFDVRHVVTAPPSCPEPELTILPDREPFDLSELEEGSEGLDLDTLVELVESAFPEHQGVWCQGEGDEGQERLVVFGATRSDLVRVQQLLFGLTVSSADDG